MRAVTYLDSRDGAWREGVATVVDGQVRVRDEPPAPDMPRLEGVLTGGFTDAHVHLQLVDHAQLSGSPLARVVDLGGTPDTLARLAAAARARARAGHNSGVLTPTPTSAAETTPIREHSPELCPPADVEVVFAGAFLTPPGGYPSDRAWAPEGAVREVADAADAARAVAEMKASGAAVIKIAGNSTAGPVFTDDLFRVLVAQATAHGLPVVAHAEGRGEAQRAVRLGATRLAHAPFSERLTDAEIAAQATSAAWISTLAIHTGEAYAIAVDNVRRFHAAGGTVRYGTDMGNGPTPVGLNPRELDALREAGIDGRELLRTLDPAPGTPWYLTPGDAIDPLDARPLTPIDLKA